MTMVDGERKRQVAHENHRGSVWRRWGSFAAVVVIALVARGYRLWDESIWYDEWVSYAHLDAATLPEFIAAERAHDAPMTPVYFALEYAWAQMVGLTPLRVRLLSVLLGTGAVAMTWLLARRMYGVWAATVSALFMALSPQQVYYAQEIRNYALVLLLALVSMYALHRARDGARSWWALNMLANGLLVWTHLFAALLVVAQAMYLALVERRRGVLAVWFACHAVLAVSLLPWVLAIDFEQLERLTEWIPSRGLGVLFRTLSWHFTYFRTEPGRVHPLNLLFLAPVGWYLIWSFRKSDARARFHLSFVLSWWLAPPLVLFAMAQLWRPCFVERYVFYTTPALYIVFGAAAAALPGVWARTLAASVAALVLAVALWQSPRPFRTDWEFIDKTIAPDAAKDPYVLVLPGYHRPVAEFHLAIAPERIEATDSSALVDDITTLVREENVVWLVLIEEGLVPSDFKQLLDGMLGGGYYEEALHKPGSYAYDLIDVPGATKTSLYWFRPLH